MFYLSYIKTIFTCKNIVPCAKIVLYKKENINLNSGFYKDLDTNFEQAYNMSEKEFSHEELLAMLKTGNIPEKQIAALKFDYVKTATDSKALVQNLTGCDGKIREAVALKINQIITTDENSRQYFCYPEIFADAAIDINANICRLVVDSAKLLKSDKDFSQRYTQRILCFTNQALDELDKFIFRDKKYVINKQLFKLYWCLETLKDFHELVDSKLLDEILARSTAQSEYTIREKAAELILAANIRNELYEQLKNDENYYVRGVFLNH